MLKLLIIILCAVVVIPLMQAKTSIDLKIKIDNDGIINTGKTKRVYPKYKTEKSLLASYARAWSKEDYALMYHLLSRDTREEWTYSKFKRLIRKDKSVNGGLKKFTEQKLRSRNGSQNSWSLVLNFKLTSARSRRIRATLVKEKNKYWYIKSGGLLPPDMSMFDR
jgi:hypothetical protein